jgi:cell division protein FtsB
MPTRLIRPSRWKMLAVSVCLVGFQVYLGYSALRGQYGTESQQEMLGQIEELKAKSASLQAEIDTYRHRVELFEADALDPDILTERARALLAMAQPDDLVIMVDPASGLPAGSFAPDLASDELSALIASEPTL